MTLKSDTSESEASEPLTYRTITARWFGVLGPLAAVCIASFNPAPGERLRTVESYSAARVNEALDRGVTAFQKHRRTSFADRAACMRRAAAILNADCRELGRLMTLEMGKPFKAAMAEAEKCATACTYYAENA